MYIRTDDGSVDGVLSDQSSERALEFFCTASWKLGDGDCTGAEGLSCTLPKHQISCKDDGLTGASKGALGLAAE
jgi:hypothetical protein